MALGKVSFWDEQEKSRELSMEEVEARKEAGGFQEMGAYEESLLETKVKKFG